MRVNTQAEKGSDLDKKRGKGRACWREEQQNRSLGGDKCAETEGSKERAGQLSGVSLGPARPELPTQEKPQPRHTLV